MDHDVPRILDDLRRLHAVVDAQARQIAAALGDALRCRPGCAACCRDDLTVFEVEALRIRTDFPELLSFGTPSRPGQCAFLDERGRCRVYSARPYVCRSHGLPLRWLTERDAQWVEVRDICPVSDANLVVEELDANVCFTLGPSEDVLRELQAVLSGGHLTRVALRDLFRSNAL